VDNDDTFDEMSDEVVEAPEPTADQTQQAEYWRKRAERAEKQAVERKVQLGRFETAAKHGITPDTIPDWVPLDKMDEFAERFATSAPSTAPTQTEAPQEDEAVTTEPEVTEAERNLAAVAKGSASSGEPPAWSEEEIQQRIKAEGFQWYQRERDAGRIPPPQRIGADYRGR